MTITPEILEKRKFGIGGSEVGTILGVNPYETKRDLALRKLGLLPEKEETAPMKRGTALEPLIADIFQETTGIEVVEEKQILVHPEHPWMLGNIDRWAMPDKAVLEIKAPGMAVFSKIRREGLPESWILQLQHYLAITGSQFGFFAVFNSELWKLEHFRVESDTELQAIMIDAAGRFWNDLQNGIIPEDDTEVIELPPMEKGELLKIDTPEWCNALQEYHEAQEILKEAEEVKDAAKAEILKLMGSAPIAEGGGVRIYNRLQAGRTSIDTKRLKKEMPEVFAKYSRQGKPFAAFRVYELKGM